MYNLDGINYTFTSDGKVKLTGWNSINGTRYYFNASGMVISNSVKLVIDISHHQGNINWGNEYEYVHAENANFPSDLPQALPYIIISYGADKKKDSDEKGDDIVSWK